MHYMYPQFPNLAPLLIPNCSNSSEEEAEVEDLESIRNNPDLHKLNKVYFFL